MSCDITKDKGAKLLYGHYGSKTIISIKDKHVYKYFPIMLHYLENNNSVINWSRKINSEISIFKILTNEIVNTNISPHIVRILKIKKCKNKPSFYKNCKLDEFKKWFEDENSIDSQYSYCHYVERFPKFKIEKPMYIIKLEYCNSELTNLLYDNIKTYTKEEYINFLNVIIFQVIFTLQVIIDKYPKFIHKDLFIKNILCIKSKGYKNKYNRYHYKNKIYDVPAIGYTTKINDFGITQINEDYGNYFQWIPYNLLKDNFKDHFTFLIDLFREITPIVENYNKDINTYIDNVFNKFLDLNAIYSIKNNKNLHYFLGYHDDATEYNGFIKFIKLKTRYQILKQFENIFKYDANHQIIEEYNK